MHETETRLEQIWKQVCINHYFELECAKAIDEKLVTCPTYLSLGQEVIPATLGSYLSDWPLFAQHRCHSWYLSWGGDPYKLALELMGHPDGCNQGYGGSASIDIPGKMFGHDGLLGSNAPIAVGYARATKKPVICVLGDAAAEEDYVFGAFTVAARDKVPILFIVEDNGLSILTKTEVRRSWHILDVAKACGIYSIWRDDNVYDLECISRWEVNMLPSLVNIKTERHRWHAGSGTDGPPQRDAFLKTGQYLTSRMELSTLLRIEIAASIDMTLAWDKAKERVSQHR
jgi:TPP-dependent pyruvate/acetoin dehydrogenase alpha subunit